MTLASSALFEPLGTLNEAFLHTPGIPSAQEILNEIHLSHYAFPAAGPYYLREEDKQDINKLYPCPRNTDIIGTYHFAFSKIDWRQDNAEHAIKASVSCHNFLYYACSAYVKVCTLREVGLKVPDADFKSFEQRFLEEARGALQDPDGKQQTRGRELIGEEQWINKTAFDETGKPKVDIRGKPIRIAIRTNVEYVTLVEEEAADNLEVMEEITQRYAMILQDLMDNLSISECLRTA